MEYLKKEFLIHLSIIAEPFGAKVQRSDRYYAAVSGLTKKQAEAFKRVAVERGFLLCGQTPNDGEIEKKHGNKKVVTVLSDDTPVTLFYHRKQETRNIW